MTVLFQNSPNFHTVGKIFSTLLAPSLEVTGIPYSGPLTFGCESRKEAENLQKYKLVHRNSQA